MSEHDDLLAQAQALGVTVDRRWGVARIRKAIEDASAAEAATGDDGSGDNQSSEDPDAELDADPDGGPAAAEVNDGWPLRLAPLVWLDQDGRRYTNEGAAMAGAQECRDRSG